MDNKPQNATSTTDVHLFDLDQYRSRMASYLPETGSENEIFFDALRFAYELHAGQRRKSGAPYISHPCAVAEILARELKFRDPVLLASALLHDVVEDIPGITLDDIETRFGPVVAELVDGCTKLTRRHLDKATLRDLTHSKIFLSSSRRLGVLVIKLADRLHNLRTLHYLPLSKRQRIAQETVEVYAPIAARMNIFPLKRELYHLALTYLYPRKSKKILQLVRDVRNSPEVAEIERTLKKIFSDAGIDVTVRTRSKGLGTYYDHLKRTLEMGNAENQIDFAIILHQENVLQCYTALGLINTNFSPIPRSLRDFIATSKGNGYQSLHVRIHAGGHNYLVKIRTPDMDEWAMYGILREWAVQKPMSDDHWQEVSELLRTIGEYGGASTQRKALIRLSESEEIYVYSPKGDIYFLPKGSVVLDFAYRIHSELGDYCEGALINNEWAHPTHTLNDGDTVQIVTSSEPLDMGPDLEEHCKTPKARNAINKHLQQKRRHYAQEVGRQILLQELVRHGWEPEILADETIKLVLEVLNLRELSELFIRIGQDLLPPHLVLYYLGTPSEEHHVISQREMVFTPVHDRNRIHITELDKAVHKFARCCHPYPGQAGAVATLSERGTTFHHRDCGDLRNRHDLEPQQLVDVEWASDLPWPHPMSFDMHIMQETAVTLIPFLAHLPSPVEIVSLESAIDRHDMPMVRMTVIFRNFEEVRKFFECISADRISIEDYGRKDTLSRLHKGYGE